MGVREGLAMSTGIWVTWKVLNRAQYRSSSVSEEKSLKNFKKSEEENFPALKAT